MTDPVEERSYRGFRRYVFAATIIAIVALITLLFVA
jgi:hypothetical protein